MIPSFLRIIIFPARQRHVFLRNLVFLVVTATLFYLCFNSYKLSVTKEVTKKVTNIDDKLVAENILPNAEDFRKYSDQNPGETGKPFRLFSVTEREEKLVSEGWNRTGINQFVSDLISVKRSLPQQKYEWCKTQDYTGNSVSRLKATSVIICFHNEAFSVLLRAVNSILDRSPEDLITEIILVDDFSDLPALKETLQDYFRPIPKVRIIRTKKREGLIHARLIGTSLATGPILTFLDSRTEVAEGWLEPLLARITENSTRVVSPIVDKINKDTFEYSFSDPGVPGLVGGFDWGLQYKPQVNMGNRINPFEPLKSATIPAGALFSIDKAFFTKLGRYDGGLEGSGGENMELSFKTWMCGGSLEVVPCSHVGHVTEEEVSRLWDPNGNNGIRRNAIRVAEVWMDEYKKYFYERIGNNLGDFGDVSERQMLRGDLNCKSFKWYLDNVILDIVVPAEGIAHGEIRNFGFGGENCIDAPSKREDLKEAVGLDNCHGHGGNQFWVFSKTGEIHRDGNCLDFSIGSESWEVNLVPCHGKLGNQFWTYNENTKQIQHASQNCLTAVHNQALAMLICNEEDENQTWKLENYHKSTVENSLPQFPTSTNSFGEEKKSSQPQLEY